MYISLFLLLVLFAGYFTDASLILNGKTQVYENIEVLNLSCDLERSPETNFTVKRLDIKAGQRIFATLLDDKTTTVTTLFDVTATGHIDNAKGSSNLNMTIWRTPSTLSTRTYRCYAAVKDESGEENIIQSNNLAVKVLKPDQQQASDYTWNQLKNVNKLDAKLEQLLLLTSKLETSMKEKENASAAEPMATQQQVKSLEEKIIQKVSITQQELLTAKQKEALEEKKTQDELKKQIANLEKNVQTVSNNQAKPNPEVQVLKNSQEALKTQISNIEKTTQTFSSNQAKPNPEIEELKKSLEVLETQISNLEKTIQTLSINQAKPNPEVQEMKKNLEALKSQTAKPEEASKRGVRLEEGSYSCGYDFKDFPKAGTDSSRIEEVQVQYKQKFAKTPFVFQSVLFQDIDIEDEIMYAIDIKDQTNAGFVGLCVKYQTPVIYELQVKWFAIEVD